MDTWNAYRSRRNVRDYTSQPIAADVLERILEAGRRAPSAFNSQPWEFVVVQGASHLSDLSEVWRGARHVASSAATIAVLTPIETDPDRARWAEFDLGQAVAAMTIVAADAGIGSAHALIEDQDLLRRLLGSPDTHRGAYLLALGHPGDRPLSPIARPNRRPFDEVVHVGRW
ncbi:MAG: nitroreductase family protein [Thermoleophilia bacterium]|nr:nitroreductase family protein [Thermoleophilia bacterium]